jgi:hypothetical protein
VPGLQPADQQQIDEQIEIGSDSLAIDAERAG